MSAEPLVAPRDVAIGVALAVLLVGPSVAAGGLVGAAGAEVYGHAWVQWWATEQWPAWPTGTDLADGAARWPVIDPLPTWIVAAVAQGVGSTAAWNLWAAAGIVLSAVGGGAFARALAARDDGGPEAAGVVGAVGAATMPIFLGSLTSGLTEDYALGLVALSLAALLRGRLLLGGALLGLTAWCGLYLAWLGGLAAFVLGAWRLARAPRALGGWLAAGLLALLLAAPAVAPFRSRLDGQGHHRGSFRAAAEPLWPVNPWRGADLASFFAPGKVDVSDAYVREHPVYLGYATLVLAAAGGWHPAWLGVVACAAVAPGETLSFAGRPLGIDDPLLPAFRLLPFASRFNHHARVQLLGQLLLVGLAARGLTRRVANAPRWVPWIAAGVILAETTLLSPARVPLPTVPASTPAIYSMLATLPADAPVVVVGAAGPGIHPQRVFFDQRAHGRRLLHGPNHPKDGRPRSDAIVVALGPAVARVTADRGPPDVTAADGAAWGPRP